MFTGNKHMHIHSDDYFININSKQNKMNWIVSNQKY